MDDGSAGLWMVKRAGGTAIVQDPLDTAYPEMPQNAMRYVKVDYIASAPAIAKLLAKISAGDSNASQQDANPSVAGEFGHGTRKDEAY